VTFTHNNLMKTPTRQVERGKRRMERKTINITHSYEERRDLTLPAHSSGNYIHPK